MIPNYLRLPLILFWLGLGAGLPAKSFGQAVSTQNEKMLAQAESFLLSYQCDSSIHITLQLIETLKRRNELDSPFGLRVQYVYGRAAEFDDRDSIAMGTLLHVKEKSEQTGAWETYAKACVAMANLHENMGRAQACLENLRQAQTAIAKYGLEKVYPFFAMRISSYHRVFNNAVDSSLFYAREVLRTAPKHKLYHEEAVGHLLMAILLRNTEPEQSLDHYFSSARISNLKERGKTCCWASCLFWRFPVLP
jgi:hypothetical protein